MKPKFVYLHYCINKNCFPPTFFDYSFKPIACPDCGNITRLATIEERRRKKSNMSYPGSPLAFQFLMQPDSPNEKYHCPDHGIGLALDKVSRSLGGKDRSDVEETVSKWWKFWL